MTAQIFIPLLTILFSGLLATIVTHYLTTSHQEKQFNRQKLEELYFAMDGFCTFFGTFNAYWPGVVEGKIDYNAALDKARSDRKNERFHQTAEMRKDKHCVDLISDVLPFGRLWYDTPDNAIGYAMHSSRSHDAVIRVYDEAGNVIETHELGRRFRFFSTPPADASA